MCPRGDGAGECRGEVRLGVYRACVAGVGVERCGSSGLTAMNSLALNRWIYGQIVYPSVVRAIGEGTLFRRLEALESIQWWPTEKVEELQKQRLAELLSYAAAHTEHY